MTLFVGQDSSNFIQLIFTMKKIILSVFVFVTAGLAAQAQVKPIQTATIKTPNALCELCKERIEGYLKRYDGVTDVQVNYRRGETKVKFAVDRINIEEIKTALANCGYDADDVPATPDAYNRLPKSCKKAEDGGGHPKPKVPVPPPPGQ
jgi:mercuric ion binding protein